MPKCAAVAKNTTWRSSRGTWRAGSRPRIEARLSGGSMKAAFGGLLLAAALAATPAMADPVADPDPAPARSSAATSGGRFRPAQAWGGIGYYNTGAGANVGQFGFNVGASYAV